MINRALSFSILGLALTVPAVATAAPISIYQAPDNTYQNTANNPCVFYGPGACPADPTGWPTPTGNTNGDFGTLNKTYTGASYTAFTTVVGTSFILGLDINDTSVAQTLSTLTIDFLNAGGTSILNYTFSPSAAVPDVSNGVGYADYILAAGCSGTTSGSGVSQTCTNYTPFVAPVGTTQIAFSFGYTGGNDGPDKLFAISLAAPPTTPVPEPTSLLLLGAGLAVGARRLRRRA
jgi:hypothetical protein